MSTKMAMMMAKAGHSRCRVNHVGDHAQLSTICAAQMNIAGLDASRRNVRAPAMPIST